MHFEDFKVWHWMLIGLIAGALFSGVRIWGGRWFDTAEGIYDMDQLRFERGLVGVDDGGSNSRSRGMTAQYRAGKSLVKDLVVHPPTFDDSRYWVTGKVVEVSPARQNEKDPNSLVVPEESWIPFKYPASSPYQTLPLNERRLGRKATTRAAAAAATAAARAAKKKGPAAATSQPTAVDAAAPAVAVAPAPPKYPTVVAYLQTVSQEPEAKFTYRYAWQELPVATAVLPPLAGFMIIGVAWPMTLRLMMGAGLARKPQPRAKLPKNRKSTSATAARDHSAGDAQLAELNAKLEAEMAGFVGPSVTNDPDESRAGMPGIKQLTAGAAGAGEVVAKESDEIEVKDYGGEFYPVVRSTHIEHRGEHDEAGENGKEPVAASDVVAVPAAAAAPVPVVETPPPPPEPITKGPSAKAPVGTKVKVKVPLFKPAATKSSDPKS